MTPDDLNTQFAIPGAISFEAHPSGLTCGRVSSPSCEATFFLHGGHVAAFRPAGQDEVLFMSGKSMFEDEKAIRGGVPICFPWFGANPSEPNAPSHGLARTAPWNVVSISYDERVVRVEFSRQIAAFELRYTVRFGKSMELDMQVRNTSNESQSFELALHSYFNLSDSSQVAIRGLENLDFIDQLSGNTMPAEKDVISFSAETDRIYHWPSSQPEPMPIEIRDPGLSRTISLVSSGSRSTVVWNPWIAKSQRMADFGDAEYQKMCCVETANIGSQAIQLAAEERATTSVRISVSEG